MWHSGCEFLWAALRACFSSSNSVESAHAYERAMSEQADVLFKLIVIGDTGTGKSCLLHRFVEGK